MSDGFKICKKCLESLPLESFYNRSSGTKDGKYSYCIPCTKLNQKEYRGTDIYKNGNVVRHKRWRDNHRVEFGKRNRKFSKKLSSQLDDNYIIKRIKGNESSRLTANQIRKYPDLINAVRENIKLKRLIKENN